MLAGVGSSTLGFATISGGEARSASDNGPQPFAAATKFGSASLAKVFTALAAIQLLTKPGRPTVTSPIGQWLPAGWTANAEVSDIRFAELLSLTSGVDDSQVPPGYPGANGQDYGSLKTFFTDPNLQLQARAKDKMNEHIIGGRPVLYSNTGFALFRLLIPRLAGVPDDAGP